MTPNVQGWYTRPMILLFAFIAFLIWAAMALAVSLYIIGASIVVALYRLFRWIWERWHPPEPEYTVPDLSESERLRLL